MSNEDIKAAGFITRYPSRWWLSWRLAFWSKWCLWKALGRENPDRTKSVLSGQQDVEARLWQDPLSAIEKEMSAQSRADKKSPEVPSVNIHKPEVLHNKIKTLTAPPKGKNEKNNVTILAVNLFGGSFDASAEWRRRARFAVLSALEFHGYRPENADALGYYVAKLQNDEGLTPVQLWGPVRMVL